METNWIIAIIIFIVVIFIFWRLTVDGYKKEYSEKMRKVYGSRLYYWHTAILISGGITFLLMYALRWLNVLNF